MKEKESYSLKEVYEIRRSFLKVGLGEKCRIYQIEVIVRGRALEKEAQRKKLVILKCSFFHSKWGASEDFWPKR